MPLPTLQTILSDIKDDSLPWWLEEPEDIPVTYLSDNYLVLDLETTNLEYGTATNPNNRLVCAAWYIGGTDKIQYHYGNELTQLALVHDIEMVLSTGGFIVAHNAKFEIKWLMRMGVDPATVLCYDTMLGEHIIRGNRMHLKVNLNDTAQRYGCSAKAYYVDKMLKCGICPSEMDQKLIRARVLKDVRDTATTFLQQREILNKNGQLGMQATRCIFTPVLADIEMEGIHLNRGRVLSEHQRVSLEYEAAQREWVERYGDINPRSTPQMATLIYEELGFSELKDRRGNKVRNKPSKAFPNGAPKVDNGTLSKLEVATEAQVQFMELRRRIGDLSAKLTKTLDFFKRIVEEKNGVFYGEFNQHLAQTHRLTSSSVRVKFEDGTEKGIQLQNMPRAYKDLIDGGEGKLVGESDGSQLEFRVAAFLGADKQAIHDIRNDVDRHVQTAKELFGYSDDDWGNLSKEDKKTARQDAKAETFKPLYGGRRGTPEQERYYKWFREQFPDLSSTQEGWTFEVLANGSLRMPWGMVWYWPGTKQDSRTGYIDNTPSIYNYPVQSLATAEIIPIAVTYLWHRARRNDHRIRLFNTIHDSAVAKFPEECGPLYKALSIQSFTLDVYKYLEAQYDMDFDVPLGVGIGIGTRWNSPDTVETELNVERDGTYWYKGSKGG